MRYQPLLSIAAIAIAAMAPQSAHAAPIVLNLQGAIANTTTNAFDFAGRRFNTGNLILTGLTPFTINVGDTIEVNVTLDGPFTVPASGEQFFGLNFFNSEQGTIDPTSTQGTFTFANSGGPTGLENNTVNGGCGNCTALILGRGAAGAFSFTSFFATTSVDQLTPSPFTIDSASISYQLSGAISAVPEPASWALMIGGFGLVGGAMRRRMPVTATVSHA